MIESRIIPKTTINGTTNARKCGLFNSLYNAHNCKGFCYSGINILENGTIRIDVFLPSITKEEIHNFRKAHFKFYQNELPNKTISTHIRGGAITDAIIDPTIYADNRISKINTQKFCMAFLVDTETDTIVAARVLCLGDNFYNKLAQSLNKMIELEITTEDILSAFWEYIDPKDLDECLKGARYIGKDHHSFTPNIITTA